ncbi:MAG: methyltransferase domain-containing protein [Ruminococcaceae bacterium]|nr:methyltransferase domain-containing protein [Oscillospiraceae bacterium]
MEELHLLPGERLDNINENLRLIQKTDGLTFGTDAYLLAAFLRTVSQTEAAELGGGTGVLSLLALSRQKASRTVVWEIQPEFADLCRRNAALNGLAHRMDVVCGDVREIRGEQKLDLVYANPPYMKGSCGKENTVSAMNIARREVHGSIADFCGAADRLLKHGGTFSLVYRPDRFADLVCALRENHMEVKRVVFVYPSLANRPCLVLAEAKKGAASGMVLAPPLCIYTDAGKKTYTPEMDRIYETCSMEFLFPGTERNRK